MTPDNRVEELKLILPPPFHPTGLFQAVVIVDNYVHMAGHGPMLADGQFITGKVGVDLTVAQARAAARQTGLSILASLRGKLGSLNRVNRVVKSLGMINCTPEFSAHPTVIDGCSELFAEVFGGENGVGARSAVGMSSLPFGIPVEIETLLQIQPE